MQAQEVNKKQAMEKEAARKRKEKIVENTWLEHSIAWLIQDCTTKQVKTQDISVKVWTKNSL